MEGEHTFDEIDQAATMLESMVRGIDVSTLTGPGATRLGERLVTAERVLAACRGRAVQRAAEANQWRQAGEPSPAAWAAKLTGTSTGQAAAELETTRQLGQLAATQAARASGQLSDLQARELASAATADPTAEAELLRRAKVDDAKAFKRRCDAVRAAAEQDESARRERIRRARRFRSWTDAEGGFCFTGRGLPEEGAALLAAMKPYQDQAFHVARRRGEREATDAYAYDGLIGMARHDAGHQCPTTTTVPTSVTQANGKPGSGGPGVAQPPGDTGTAANSGTLSDRATLFPAATAGTWRPPPVRPGSGGADPTGGDELAHDCDAVLADCFRPGPRAKLIVRIDHTALLRGHATPGEACEIAGIGPIPVATARELVRDAFLTAVVTDGSDIRTVVHLGRAATAHQRTALEARGIICAVPGCGTVHGLEIDHVDGWAITRRTHIDQLDWLCHHHHQQKTHHSWRLTGPPGNRTWHPPGGPAG